MTLSVASDATCHEISISIERSVYRPVNMLIRENTKEIDWTVIWRTVDVVTWNQAGNATRNMIEDALLEDIL